MRSAHNVQPYTLLITVSMPEGLRQTVYLQVLATDLDGAYALARTLLRWPVVAMDQAGDLHGA